MASHRIISGRSGTALVRRPAVCILLLSSVATAAVATGHPAETPRDPSGKNAVEQVGAAAHPVATFDQTDVDLGTVWIGPELRHGFRITNTGQAVLEIERVRPGCGCLLAGVFPRRLEPGERSEIPIKFQTAKMRGRFEKTLSVHTNDPENPMTVLSLSGVVRHYIEAKPQRVVFDRLGINETRTLDVILTSYADDAIELTLDDVPTRDGLTYSLAEIEPGRQFKLSITAGLPRTPGNVRGGIRLKTSHDIQKQVSIGMEAPIPARLELRPGSIVVPHVKPGASVKSIVRNIRLVNNGDRPVKLLDATTDAPEQVIATIETIREGREYRITAEIVADYDPPAGGATITLATDDRVFATMRIPIHKPRTRRNVARTNAEAMVGRPAPEFLLTSVDGKRLSRPSVDGRITVLNFFAANDYHSKRQLPVVEKLRRAYENCGVTFVHVLQTSAGQFIDAEVAARLLAHLGVGGLLAIDPASEVGRSFHVESHPTMVVLGEAGRILAVHTGDHVELEARVSTQLDTSLGLSRGRFRQRMDGRSQGD